MHKLFLTFKSKPNDITILTLGTSAKKQISSKQVTKKSYIPPSAITLQTFKSDRQVRFQFYWLLSSNIQKQLVHFTPPPPKFFGIYYWLVQFYSITLLNNPQSLFQFIISTFLNSYYCLIHFEWIRNHKISLNLKYQSEFLSNWQKQSCFNIYWYLASIFSWHLLLVFFLIHI